MSKIIGIDLGTSNSAAAVMEGGKAVHYSVGRRIYIRGESLSIVCGFYQRSGFATACWRTGSKTGGFKSRRNINNIQTKNGV